MQQIFSVLLAMAKLAPLEHYMPNDLGITTPYPKHTHSYRRGCTFRPSLEMRSGSLTISQKRRLCEEAESRRAAGTPASLVKLGEWAQAEFNLEKRPGKATISRTLANPNRYLGMSAARSVKQKRLTKGRSHELEQALYNWICDQCSARRNVSAHLMKLKASRLQAIASANDPNATKLTFSEGWFAGFKKRWGLQSFRSANKTTGADTDSRSVSLPKLRDELQTYEPGNIFTADEFGLFYSCPPDKNIATQPLRARNGIKDRITVLACCNAKGSERLPLFFIGSASKPEAFKSKDAHELGLHYASNQRSWITGALFYDWLKRFESYINKTQGRRVILLLDNCSAHGSEVTLPQLSNVVIRFLPPNTTSMHQPFDEGITVAIKLRFRKRQVERAMDLFDEGEANLFQVDILTAMRWLVDIWDKMECDILLNCWNHSNVLGVSSQSSVTIQELLRDESTLFESHVSEIIPQLQQLPIWELLNNAEENNCTQQIRDGDRVATASGNREEQKDKDTEQQTEEVDEQLRALAIVKRIAESRNVSAVFYRELKGLQSKLRAERSGNLVHNNDG